MKRAGLPSISIHKIIMFIRRFALPVCLNVVIMFASGNVSAAKLEKCAGILKDRDKKAWLALPKGTCEKLVGGKLVVASEGRKSKMKEALVIHPTFNGSTTQTVASASPTLMSTNSLPRISK